MPSTLLRLARTAAYFLLGAVGTAVIATGVLAVSGHVRVVIFETLYLAVGPWTATTAATVLPFTIASLLGAGGVTILGQYLRTRQEHLREVALIVGGVVGGSSAILVVTAATGMIGFLVAIVVFALAIIVVPVGLYVRAGWSGGVWTFSGAIPVLVLLVFLLGFGLGWGGGYDVRAEPVSPAVANQSTVVDLAEAQHLRQDLFTASACSAYDEGVCQLQLRGYDHEASVGRFLARHGVRCGYLNAPQGYETETGSLIAEHDGAYYRISCLAYGD